jgi:lipopolysaccharide transport system permease protein
VGRAHGRGAVTRALANLRGTFDLLISLTASDFRTRYGHGPFLLVRWLLEPFALVGVYLILMVVVLDRPGNAPGLSIACAIVPFQLIMNAVTNGMGSVAVRRPIIANMAFRRSLIPLSSVLTESASFVASFAIIATMMILYGVSPTPALLWLPVVVGVTLTVAAGLAYPASLFGVWFRELRPFGTSVVRILFFIGPGLVPLAEASEDARDWLRLNPLTGLFESFRDVFLYGESPAAWQLLYPLVFAGLLLVVAVPLYRREQREFAKVIT